MCACAALCIEALLSNNVVVCPLSALGTGVTVGCGHCCSVRLGTGVESRVRCVSVPFVVSGLILELFVIMFVDDCLGLG